MYTRTELVLKRAFDVTASLLGLAAVGPVLAATAALVKLSSPGPVLFRQTRVGRSGRPFELLKFRTMRQGASGPEITAGHDPRITRVGRVLRKTKLDELPELLNVLRGDLSLVGPRPEVPRYVALYPRQDRDFLQQYRPGITDPATILFRNEEDVLSRAEDPEAEYVQVILPKKLGIYRRYLENASFLGDLGVLFDTARVIVQPDRAPR
ncbi:MAG TPA: sugar transferase [Polyangiaceae bacterium]|nr:sugar transferase [Polyangiaceae bacterium]